jgi:hypothetical protein
VDDDVEIAGLVHRLLVTEPLKDAYQDHQAE